MCTLWSTLADTLAEVEAVTLGERRGDAQALVNTVADTLAVFEAVTLGDRRGDAQALIDTLADALAEVESVTLETDRAMRTHWSTLWLTSLQKWRR